MKTKTSRKTIAFILIAILSILCLAALTPKKTLAAGVEIYADNDTPYVGDSVTVTVTLYGDEIYAYSGYIGCDGILSGANESFADGAGGDGSVSFSYTYRAVSEGEGAVYVSDCMVSDGISKESCGGGACYITVLGYDEGGGGTGGNAGGEDYNDDYSYDGGYINGNETGEGSGNCDLASLSVEGYELKDEGHDIYSVTVGGSVEKIKIVAQAEDENAYVEGAGEKKLEVGENVFDITVTAENGLQKTYTVKVTRRGDKILLADLLAYLSDKNNTEETVTVKLKDGDILTSDMISAIGKWGKTLYLNQYDKDGKLTYGWTLNGKNVAAVKEFKEFNPAVTFKTDNSEKINELSNYAASKFLNFAYSGVLPEGTQFSLDVSKSFKDTDKVRLYYFNPETVALELVKENLTAEKGILKFDLAHCSDYILTRSKINAVVEEKPESNNNLLFIIIIAVALAIIVALVIVLLVVMNKNKKKKPKENGKESSTNLDALPVVEVEELELGDFDEPSEDGMIEINTDDIGLEETETVWQKKEETK
ncbi:MAG: cadherin-like beta sandwich domain-containing protein [Lachnospiraceae bacterium]|nr:cadherin-like beta sandwich domain-containing protein [Lachnospiraceae bacterium]